MFFLSTSPFKTQKTMPTSADNRSAGLLLQAGFVRQEMAGVYHFLPMGLRVIRNIEKIVRKGMESLGAHELLMPALGSYDHWNTTGRWNTIDVLFHLPGSDNKEYALNPTHEDLVTPLLSEFIQSYKDLEFGVYQIQNKFRNEKRAKSGILRGREFIMKDLYSFHKNEAALLEYYDRAKQAYKQIFIDLGLGDSTYETLASGGDFTTLNSHEYQTILPIGEDEIYICTSCGTSHNKEVVDTEGGFVCSACQSREVRIERACEVGNIFPLMTRFTEAFKMKYTDANGAQNPIYMGCYGIGISRLMGVIAEKFADEKGLVWPESVAPFTHEIIVIGDHLEEAKKLANKLEDSGKTVLIDDRDTGFGAKAGDSDLFGIPYRIILSDKTLAAGGYEIKSRTSAETCIESL